MTLPDWPAAMGKALAAIQDDRAPYSVARLAERWECSERLIYKLIERGDLPELREGGVFRMTRFNKWLRPLSYPPRTGRAGSRKE